MRVLHVETGRHIYGGPRQVLHLIAGLAKRGDRPVLLCQRGSAVAAAAQSLPATVVAMRGAGGPATAWRVWRLVREHEIELVHLHSRRGADDFGALGARLAGAGVVLSRRVDNRQPRWLLWLKRPLYDRVVAISRAIRRVLLADGMPRKRVHVVPSAIEPAGQEAEGRHAIRQAFGLPAESEVVAMVAQMIERKGHRTLLAAMPRIVAHRPGVRFVLLGQGPLREELERLVAERGLGGQVVFGGFREDVRQLLAGVEVLAHPAEREGLGVALLEAAQAGVAIVAGRAGGIPEIVRDGQTGRLVEPGDAPGLAEAVIELLKDPAERRRLAEGAQARVAARFSVEAMVTGNRRVYERVLAERGSGRRGREARGAGG